MATILFVCTGNLCRSPMAEALFRAMVANDPTRQEWRSVSSGVRAQDGYPASGGAVMAMADRGIQLQGHQSQQVTESLVAQSDLILGMTPHHVEALRAAYPRAVKRIHLLAKMAGESHGVADPYGLSVAEYRACANELERLIESGYDRIVTLAENRQ